MTEEEAIHSPAGKSGARLPRLAAAVAGLMLIVIGVLAAVSYPNTIRPSGTVFHHTALPLPPDGSPIDIRVLDDVHKRRGLRAFYWGRFYHVGYHYVILPDGTVQSGRPERCRGAHAVGYNSFVGVCLVGGFNSADNPGGEEGPQEPTPAQVAALLELTTRLRERYDIPPERVIQHRDVSPNTQCPGDRFPFEQLTERLRRLRPEGGIAVSLLSWHGKCRAFSRAGGAQGLRVIVFASRPPKHPQSGLSRPGLPPSAVRRASKI